MRLRFNSLPVALVLGVFEMEGANTPGVGAVLRDHGLRCVPEAHCYLAHEGARVDLTRERGGAGQKEGFLHEEEKLRVARGPLLGKGTAPPSVQGSSLLV